MFAIRFPLAMMLSLLLAGTIFWALWTLINQDSSVGKLLQATRIEFTRMRKDTQVESKRDEKVEREKPKVAPEVPKMSMAMSGVDNIVAILNPTIDPNSAMRGLSLTAGSDRDVIPLVRINPEYPQRALSRGIEGWVIVQFTITAAGTVKDPKVVDADPKGIFDDAAIKSILRWRYNPKVEEGVAVERVGIRTLLRFQIEQ
ncbi:MAG: tonB [Gammaproteobacteria bacterium]|nr:tonB [Gammaproteobacteria bacterium]